MREIIFRGKRKDNGEWVEGIPMRTNSTEIGIGKKITFMNVVPWTDKRKGKILAYFDPKNCPAIDDNTICQYTGLCDKNGTKIFEGDILSAHLDNAYPEDETLLEVIWHNNGWYGKNEPFFEDFNNGFEKHFEVIGNVHDNPELLQD